MSRRGNSHTSAARSAPFGTDIQPHLDVKIIGGVAVEVPAQPPTRTRRAGWKGSYPSLCDGPHGTPPIQTQPLNSDYISEQHSRVASITSNHEDHVAVVQSTAVHPTTSPSDYSNSHIHRRGAGRHSSFPNPNRVLPPISPRPSVSQPVGAHQPSQRSIQSPLGSPIALSLPHITLSDQLRPYLTDYDPQRFKDMYSDLAEFDRLLTGYVNEGQIGLISLKHKLPIPTPLMKLLLSSFVHDTDADLVNYEKLIQYLARVQLGTANAETLLEEAVKRFVEASDDIIRTELLETHIAEALDEEALQQRAIEDQVEEGSVKTDENQNRIAEVPRRRLLREFPEQENVKFMSLLEQQYALNDDDPHDFDAMRETFGELDPSASGVVAKDQIDKVCLLYRVPVQGPLMDKLLLRCDTGNGLYSWSEFISYLERAQPVESEESEVTTDTVDQVRPTTWPSVERTRDTWQRSVRTSAHLEDAPVWEQRKPLGRLEMRDVPIPKDVSKVEMDVTRDDTPTTLRDSTTLQSSPCSEDQREADRLAELARQHRRRREEQERAVLQKQQSALNPSDDPWFERYMHLARGVYNSDSSNSGFLDIDEMFRLIKNYNLIYQLGLSTARVQTVVTSYAKGHRKVPIEPILATLRLEKPSK